MAVDNFTINTQLRLERLYVYRTEFFRIFRIGLGFIGNFLAFLQSSVPLGYNRREMYEHVVATFIAGDESVALFCVEPLNSTLTHSRYPLRFATDNEPLGSAIIIAYFFVDCNTKF